jgi:PIN domain nuclease of toxin-antitoxin system
VAAEVVTFVLDSFALLAYLEGEVGQPTVQTLMAGAEAGTHTVYLSLINLGEALTIIERERGLAPQVQVDQPVIHRATLRAER